MKESVFTLEIRKSLASLEGMYVRKIVAAMGMSNAGIPDILGCYRSKFFAIECKCIKLPKRAETEVFGYIFTEGQIINLNQIKDAGGKAIGLIYIDDIRRCIFWDWRMHHIKKNYFIKKIEQEAFHYSYINAYFQKLFID